MTVANHYPTDPAAFHQWWAAAASWERDAAVALAACLACLENPRC